MRIDCSECAMYRSEHCDDCLVTALLRPPGAVEWDEDLEAPLEALAGGGLIPVLKFMPRAHQGSPSAEEGHAAL
jgi:hypothetical protein